jgi:hypothetical protein
VNVDLDLNMNLNATLDLVIDRKLQLWELRAPFCALDGFDPSWRLSSALDDHVDVERGVEVQVHVEVKVNALGET